MSMTHNSTVREMLQRCAAGGPKLSPRDQKIASAAMVVSALILATTYIVLRKLYHATPAVEAVSYASFPSMWLIYAQTAYLRKRPWSTQAMIVFSGVAAMYLFMLGTCVLAARL